MEWDFKDIFIGMLYFIPEEKKQYCHNAFENLTGFFFENSKEYSVLNEIKFVKRWGDCAESEEILDAQAALVHSKHLKYHTKDNYTIEIQTQKVKKTYEALLTAKFSEEAKKELENLSKKFQERFCLDKLVD